MTYIGASDNTSYTITVSAAGIYAAEGWVNYNYEMDLSATGKSTSSYGPWQSRIDKGSKHDFVTSDKTFTFSKGTSSATKTIKAKVTNKNTGSTSTATLSLTIPALKKYTITYNANGGSGAPGSQAKYYGKTLKLTTAKPIRTGYTFKGWSTSSSATSATWSAGGNYTTNASNTLYAVWEAKTYTITLDANGGSGGTSVSKTYGEAVALPINTPTKANYNFKGWAKTQNAATAEWVVGDVYNENITENTTLYAVWELAYIKPQIGAITAYRVADDGATLDDTGTKAKIIFSWTAGKDGTTALTPTSIKIQMKETGASTYSNIQEITGLGTATSGTVTSNAISSVATDKQYDVRVTITDSMGSNTRDTYISKASFVIDVNADGTAISFGEPAEDGVNKFASAMPSFFKKETDIPYLKAATYGINGFTKAGDRWGVIPYVMSDGMMEVGKYIDFHESDGDTGDYAGRLSVESGTLKFGGKEVSLSDHTHTASEVGAAASGHTHNQINNSDGVGQVILTLDSGYYYLRPYAASKVCCGSANYPWYKTVTERLEVTESRVQCQPTYDNTNSYATNMYVGNTGLYSRTTKTSSRTIKHDIKPVEDEDLKPENLYELPVVQFKYNQEDVNLDENDCRYDKNLIGFIIEDMDEKFPIAVDKPSDNVKDWSWNDQYMIPAMLKLIQDQKKEIDKLKDKVEMLERQVNK